MADRHQLECLACHGVYWDLLTDGTAYYHVCPEHRAVDRGLDPTDPDRQKRLIELVPIANRRNENVLVKAYEDVHNEHRPVVVILAEGAGVRVLQTEADQPTPAGPGGGSR